MALSPTLTLLHAPSAYCPTCVILVTHFPVAFLSHHTSSTRRLFLCTPFRYQKTVSLPATLVHDAMRKGQNVISKNHLLHQWGIPNFISFLFYTSCDRRSIT